MATDRSPGYLTDLVNELRKLPRETEWLEFKINNSDPQEIGEYISALSNSAALCGKAQAYLVWGVQDSGHDIVGTSFAPDSARVGAEELENWLVRLLSPRINFRFYEVEIGGRRVIVLEVGHAFRHPVQFQGVEYIRVGSYKKKLKDHPEKERELWRIFEQTPFEDMIAIERVTSDEILNLLDYPAYFQLMGHPLPAGASGILEALRADELIRRADDGSWIINNLGAILFAKNLGAFRLLRRKSVRVVVYRGAGRVSTEREFESPRGYASGFADVISSVNGLLPANEIIGQALRTTVPMYPELAIRELVANALIHQDFLISGTGPMIEIFADRMEITNPGRPLVQTDRFLDSPPRSRNEGLASLMRRIGVCEERGSGVDKVVLQCEVYQLPAPEFAVIDDNTRATLFAHRPLTKMSAGDRVRACYQHASLRYVSRDFMTNSSLRERFGIEERNSAIASRLIKEAIQAGMIRPYDDEAARKYMKYVPFWA